MSNKINMRPNPALMSIKLNKLEKCEQTLSEIRAELSKVPTIVFTNPEASKAIEKISQILAKNGF